MWPRYCEDVSISAYQKWTLSVNTYQKLRALQRDRQTDRQTHATKTLPIDNNVSISTVQNNLITFAWFSENVFRSLLTICSILLVPNHADWAAKPPNMSTILA